MSYESDILALRDRAVTDYYPAAIAEEMLANTESTALRGLLMVLDTEYVSFCSDPDYAQPPNVRIGLVYDMDTTESRVFALFVTPPGLVKRALYKMTGRSPQARVSTNFLLPGGLAE
jgi:hypothetical protein